MMNVYELTKVHQWPAFSITGVRYIMSDSVCTYLGLNSSETTERANIKLGTIDHHLELSVIRVMVTSP